MTNFFLEELRKIYGDGRVIHDPQFVGECCYGSLGDLRVKARFTKDIVANQYPYLTVSILNPTKGEIDSVRMKIGDIIAEAAAAQIRIFAIRNRISGLTGKRRSGMLAAPVRVIIRCWQTRLRNISAFLN